MDEIRAFSQSQPPGTSCAKDRMILSVSGWNSDQPRNMLSAFRLPPIVRRYVIRNSRFLHQNWTLDAIGLFCCRILVHNKPMIFGYARVSTDGQSVNAQVAALRKHGAGKVFREVASGAKTERNSGE